MSRELLPFQIGQPIVWRHPKGGMSRGRVIAWQCDGEGYRVRAQEGEAEGGPLVSLTVPRPGAAPIDITEVSRC